MPQVVRPSNVTIVNGPDGMGKLLITLELNINLNTNGVQVTAGKEQPVATPVKLEGTPQEPDDFNFEIPDFGSGERINFGREVEK